MEVEYQVEYDLQYFGGNYDSVGDYVVVSAESADDVPRAFTAKTGHDSAHIVNITDNQED